MTKHKNFALIGAAGYIAPKHMQAIAETGNDLIVAVDKHDSVGVIDSYFPNASFFTEFERFDRFLEKQRRAEDGQPVDFVSVCSPNYLHDAHVRLALRVNAHAICEKPLVINPWNLDQLRSIEDETQKRVFTVLQLRLHPAIQELRKQVQASDKKFDVCLTYVTRRGKWYNHSWKGNKEKSGGLAMNIGVHFFDFLLWIFGPVQRSLVHLEDPSRTAGAIELEKANVSWFLSIDSDDLPVDIGKNGGYAFRSITVDGEEMDLSAGFTGLHTKVYADILGGGGYGIEDAKPAVDLIYQIRNSQAVSVRGEAHPLLRQAGRSSFGPFATAPTRSPSLVN